MTATHNFKSGKPLDQLARELMNIKETSQDFIVPAERLTATSDGTNLRVGFETQPSTNKLSLAEHRFTENREYYLNGHSSGQLSTFAEIPAQYYRRLELENPNLLADNVNHGLGKAQGKNRMLRTYIKDNKPLVRGFVSDKYRRLDSYDLLESIFPTLQQNNMQVISSEVTEQKMYLKVLSPKLEGEIKEGDRVQYGLVISNSDVGSGSVRVEPLIYRLVCSNGMISNTAMKKYHVGRSQSEQDFYGLLTEDTRNLDDQAFWAKVKDLVMASLQPENFQGEIERIRYAANNEIRNQDPMEVVELAMRATSVTGKETKNSILASLASGNENAGFTQWGLMNAFTRTAQSNALDYQQGIELERAAGKLLDLSPKQWERIAG